MLYPETIIPETKDEINSNVNIDINNLKNKNEFKFKEFKIIAGLF